MALLSRVAAFAAVLMVGVALAESVHAREEETNQPVRLQKALPGKPLSILARANLNAPRAKPPVDLTGTWRFHRDPVPAGSPESARDTHFYPIPKLTAAAQKEYDGYLKATAEGKSYKDDTGAKCYPPGMPRMMTRVWPMQIIQLPTAIIMISGFTDQIRWIYLDGRPHTPPDSLVPSYNGESIGHWDKDVLVVDTVGFEPTAHWMQPGIPASDQMHIVERVRLMDGGNRIEIQSTMTDPVNWVGEWVNTKHYDIRDDEDAFEVHCIVEQMAKLPSAKSSYNVQ